MRIPSRLKLVLAGGLIACYGAFGFLTPERAGARPVVPQCSLCACKFVTAYSAVGASPVVATWFFFKDGAGNYSLSTQAFSTLQTKNTCDKTYITGSSDKVYPVTGTAPTNCTPTPPGGGQTTYIQLDSSGLPPPDPTPGATGITRFVCTDPP